MIAFALASHEATDFKGRQVLSMVPMASTGFAAMMAFRFAEVMARLLAIWMLVGLGHPLLALAMLLGLDPAMLIYLVWSARRLPAAHSTPLWVHLSRCCVYLDHRTQGGTLTLEPGGFFAVRGAVHLSIAAYTWQVLEGAGWNLPSGIGSAELAWTVAMVACHAMLIAYVSERFWKGARVRSPTKQRQPQQPQQLPGSLASARSNLRNEPGARSTSATGSPGDCLRGGSGGGSGGLAIPSPRRRLMRQIYRARTPLFASLASRRQGQSPSAQFLDDDAAVAAAAGQTPFRSPSSPARRQRAKVAAIAAAYGATPASVRYAPGVAGGGGLFNTPSSHRFAAAAAPPHFKGLDTPAAAAAALTKTPKVSALGSASVPATPLPVGPGSLVPLAFETELAIAMQQRNKKKAARATKFADAASTDRLPQPAAATEKKSARFADDDTAAASAGAVKKPPAVRKTARFV